MSGEELGGGGLPCGEGGLLIGGEGFGAEGGAGGDETVASGDEGGAEDGAFRWERVVIGPAAEVRVGGVGVVVIDTPLSDIGEEGT